MKVANDLVVSMNYKLTNESGETLDESTEGNPLLYIQGKGNIIPGLESEMLDKEVGDKFTVNVKPEDAYGVQNDQMVQNVPKEEFKDVPNLETGMQFQANTEQGPVIFTIKEVKEDEVIVDGNHPLAGVNLTFDIEILDIRKAAAEELSHGHVHGAGGHHH